MTYECHYLLGLLQCLQTAAVAEKPIVLAEREGDILVCVRPQTAIEIDEGDPVAIVYPNGDIFATYDGYNPLGLDEVDIWERMADLEDIEDHEDAEAFRLAQESGEFEDWLSAAYEEDARELTYLVGKKREAMTC